MIITKETIKHSVNLNELDPKIYVLRHQAGCQLEDNDRQMEIRPINELGNHNKDVLHRITTRITETIDGEKCTHIREILVSTKGLPLLHALIDAYMSKYEILCEDPESLTEK
jgi:hypothetical protein